MNNTSTIHFKNIYLWLEPMRTTKCVVLYITVLLNALALLSYMLIRLDV